jgi:hypothetical protein
MKKVFILAILVLLGQSSWAQIRDFQTTRLNSTAGAGVASILSTEAAILNPASAAFFNASSFSFHSYSTSIRQESAEREINNDPFAKTNSSSGLFVSDHSGPLKGGLAYIQQNENRHQRERMTFHAGAPVGNAAAFGLSYSYLQDQYPRTISPRRRVEHLLSLGGTMIMDEKAILGLVVQDPTRTMPGEERLLAGFQFTVADRLILLGDVGARYTGNFSKDYLWRGAAQVNLFSDFFLRAGKFYDNVQKFKGTGWGVGWIGPKLGVEFSQKMSEQFRKVGYLYQEEELVDTSLSVMINF